jgi:hypothetical protein
MRYLVIKDMMFVTFLIATKRVFYISDLLDTHQLDINDPVWWNRLKVII